MMPSSIRYSALISLLLAAPVTPSVHAAPITFTWNSTVAGSPTPGINPNDPFSISFVFDNGGTTTLSQSWTLGDFVSGTLTAGIFSDPALIAPSAFTGSFATDGTGTLIAVPVFSNLTNFIQQWKIDGTNNIYQGTLATIGVNNVSDNQVASTWSISPAVTGAVPEPGSVGLYLSLLVGMRWMRSRRKR